MQRLTRRVLVVLFTLTIGVAIAAAWNFLRRPNSTAQAPTVGLALHSENNNRTYERGIAGSATTGSFITLISSDGMSFTKWSVYCRSPHRTEQELQKRIKKAVEIVSREPMFDDDRKQIGEKIVAVFSSNVASLLWTEKEWLFQVEGSSLRDILEYRKDFKR